MFLNWSRTSAIVLTAAAAAVAPTAAGAADVVAIEEHWELHVGGPDVGRSAPQVNMVMSPTADLEGLFYVTTFNHWSYPNYSAGGVQLQRWRGEECEEAAGGFSGAPLPRDAEVISWVQRMSLDDGRLTFEVLNGSSESWGTFGGEGQLRSVTPVDLDRLNGYRPAVSLEGSGIGYAGNRVSSLTLQKLVWRTADGQQHELVAPIDIATDLDE